MHPLAKPFVARPVEGEYEASVTPTPLHPVLKLVVPRAQERLVPKESVPLKVAGYRWALTDDDAADDGATHT